MHYKSWFEAFFCEVFLTIAVAQLHFLKFSQWLRCLLGGWAEYKNQHTEIMEQFYLYSRNLSSPFQVLWLYQQSIKYFALHEELENSAFKSFLTLKPIPTMSLPIRIDSVSIVSGTAISNKGIFTLCSFVVPISPGVIKHFVIGTSISSRITTLEVTFIYWLVPLKAFFNLTNILTRRLMGSTDQADPSCIYFRISWILMEWLCFYFFVPSTCCRASEVQT